MDNGELNHVINWIDFKKKIQMTHIRFMRTFNLMYIW